MPHFVRLFLAILLGMSEERVRVIAPEVGGGFGSKLQVYGEEVLAAWAHASSAARSSGSRPGPRTWPSTHQGRDQISHVKMGAKRDGTITAFHVKIIADFGAYNMLLTPLIPSLGAFVMGGCYAIPAVQTDIVGVFTNKCPTDAIRGAGRPEATHMVEVTLDQMAAELGMDPVEIRRKNFIPKDSFPRGRRDRRRLRLGRLREDARPAARARRPRRRSGASRRSCAAQGIYRGIGLLDLHRDLRAGAVADHRPRRASGVQAGGWESAMVRVHNTGAVTVYTGASGHGQGHETAFAQIVADRLGVDPAVVEVIHGDTGMGPEGRNTYGSRSLAVGGEALARCANKIADKAKAIVAHQLEAAPEDIELRDGKFSVKGSPDKGMTLAEVAGAAYLNLIPDGMEPGLEETTFYDPENFVFPFGAHACIVDVDRRHGQDRRCVRYVAVDDCGNAINPLLIDGQVHGGIVHAIGQALYERVHYDEDGQLVTGTFVDYALPTAAELPSFETDRTVDAVAGQLARRQGRRRGRHDRRQRGGDERRDRRAAAARRQLHQHAAQPDAGLGGDSSEAPKEVRPHDSRRVRLRGARDAR